MPHPDTDKCTYCDNTEELRPYAKGGAPICYECASSPEHLEEAQESFNVQLKAIEAMIEGNEGYVMVLSHRGVDAIRLVDIEDYAQEVAQDALGEGE